MRIYALVAVMAFGTLMLLLSKEKNEARSQLRRMLDSSISRMTDAAPYPGVIGQKQALITIISNMRVDGNVWGFPSSFENELPHILKAGVDDVFMVIDMKTHGGASHYWIAVLSNSDGSIACVTGCDGTGRPLGYKPFASASKYRFARVRDVHEYCLRQFGCQPVSIKRIWIGSWMLTDWYYHVTLPTPRIFSYAIDNNWLGPRKNKASGERATALAQAHGSTFFVDPMITDGTSIMTEGNQGHMHKSRTYYLDLALSNTRPTQNSNRKPGYSQFHGRMLSVVFEGTR